MTLADDKYTMTGEEDFGVMSCVVGNNRVDLALRINEFYDIFQDDENVIYKIEYEWFEPDCTVYWCRIRKFERFKHVDSRELREHYQQKKLK